MLTWFGGQKRYCDGLGRREFLRVGGLALGGLSLANLLQLKAAGSVRPEAQGRSVIMICLGGGPSQLDTYDMKPHAPSDYRGEFEPVSTNVPGTFISPLMPRQTQLMDRISVVRSAQWVEPDHQRAEVFTGFPKKDKRPSFGSIVSRLYPLGNPRLPRFVSLSGDDGEVAMFEDPQYVGAQHRGFFPSEQGLANFALPQELTLKRVGDRKGLLKDLDRLRREVDVSGELAAQDALTAQALDMVTQGDVRSAFDIKQEPASVVARYGTRGMMYQYNKNDAYWNFESFIRARRLAEAGVPFISLQVGTWDHHGGDAQGSIFDGYRSLLPLYDRSISALVEDIYERNLQDRVLVVVWGEFGRTPRINPGAGRDHWPQAGCVLFIGGGMKMGQLIGETDARAELPTTRPYSPQNVLATLYHFLGIDPTATLPDRNGRPMYLLDQHEPIRELI